MKKILFGAANYWFSPYQVGSHHYAREFAKKGWQVGSISDPISFFHLLAKGEKRQLKERFKLFLSGGQWVEDNKIWTYVPFTLFPISNRPILKEEWVIKKSHKFFASSIKKKLKDKNLLQVDLLWLDSLKQYYLLDLIKYKKSVLRIADNNKGYCQNPLNLIKKEQELIEKCDYVVASSQLIFQKIKKIKKKNVFYLPNGVDIEFFKKSLVKFPKEYEKISSPRVIYIGAIEKWFDVNLLQFLAQKLKKVSFVLIGLPKINLKKIKNLPNVYFLGRKEYQDIPSYLNFSEVGIIPFKKNELTNYITPIKLFQYFAAGLPVVSTDLKEVRNLESPALLAQDKHDFLDKLESIINNPIFKKDEFFSFAENYTWENNLSILLNKIL